MSSDHATKAKNATELPERDGLDLPVSEHVPEELEALYEEDILDDITDVDLFDVPEPQNLELPTDDDEEPQGYLPPPGHPKGGDSVVAQRIRDTGFVMLTTDEEAVRSHLIYEGTRAERDLGRGEDALLRWRLKTGVRQREAAERVAYQRQERRKAIGAGLFCGLILGGAVWAAVLLSDATPQVDDSPVITAEVLAAVAAPVEIPARFSEVEGGTLVEVPTELWSPPLVDGSYKSWDDDGHRFWQFDYTSESAMALSWVDPSGAVRLDDTTCDNRIDGTTGRCYVGRNLARFADAPEGDWTLVGCLDGRCGPVSTFTF